MEKLILRRDVVTLEDATKQVQAWMDSDIHEAADIVYSVLTHSEASIQFWTLPHQGLPYKIDDLHSWSYAMCFIESRCWDKEYRSQRDELVEQGGMRDRQMDRIKDVALLCSDFAELFAGARKRAVERCIESGADPEFLKSKNMWEFADKTPKNRLVSITRLLASISDLSSGKAKLRELAKAFSEAYDGDKTMIYLHGPEWLCEPIIDGDYYGYNQRADIACDFVNSGGIFNSEHDEYLILQEDAVSIAQKIWMKFFNETLHDPMGSLGLNESVSWSEQATTIKNKQGVKVDFESDIAPADLPSVFSEPAVHWPWGIHHTAVLGHLEAAARRYWVNYDPSDASTAPINATVSGWLQTERKVSKTMADSIASMLRPDGLPTGPRK